ncbi:MAG: flagellar export protein FliJ [Gammaproteobacteria bacterium]|nr:flagellar export protein FliJ [Gammaproteobacteria bacterium]MBI5615837.1 flagellar export protein FliJ [Gammaproteobacteria bacterium]
MDRSKRLERLVDLSNTAERVAAQALARTNGDLQQYQTQLQELQAYRNEYQSALTGGDGVVITAYDAQKLRVFLQRIDAAIAQIEQMLANAERRCELEREAWMKKRLRADALEGVADRARHHEAGVAEQRLQREIDDLPHR